jgi:hypothetical protein
VLVKYLDLLVTIVIEVAVQQALVFTKEFLILNMIVEEVTGVMGL